MDLAYTNMTPAVGGILNTLMGSGGICVLEHVHRGYAPQNVLQNTDVPGQTESVSLAECYFKSKATLSLSILWMQRTSLPAQCPRAL